LHQLIKFSINDHVVKWKIGVFVEDAYYYNSTFAIVESYDKVQAKLRPAEEESDVATAIEESEDEFEANRRPKRKIR